MASSPLEACEPKPAGLSRCPVLLRALARPVIASTGGGGIDAAIPAPGSATAKENSFCAMGMKAARDPS